MKVANASVDEAQPTYSYDETNAGAVADAVAAGRVAAE